MAQLVRVIEKYNNDAFYISLDDNQYHFLVWLKDNDYLNEDIVFERKDKVDEIIKLF